MPRVYKAKVQGVLPKSNSVRVTIPSPVAAILGVERGDTLYFWVEPGTGRVTITRRPPTGKGG